MPTARIIRQIRQLQFVIIVRSQRRRSSAGGPGRPVAGGTRRRSCRHPLMKEIVTFQSWKRLTLPVLCQNSPIGVDLAFRVPLRRSAVLGYQAVEDLSALDPCSDVKGLAGLPTRGFLLQGLVRPMAVVVPGVVGQDLAKMLLTENQHIVQAFAAQCPCEPRVSRIAVTRAAIGPQVQELEPGHPQRTLPAHHPDNATGPLTRVLGGSGMDPRAAWSFVALPAGSAYRIGALGELFPAGFAYRVCG